MASKSLIKARELFPSVMDEFFKPWNEWLGNDAMFNRMLTTPAVNVVENKEDYSISMAAPGLKKEDFKIDIEGNMLSISSEKEDTKEEKDSRHTRREYNYSSFSRSFTIPEDIMKDKIDAAYTDGILKITLPKSEASKKAMLSKHIAVK
jgi:HSP20 family protein